jgi:hypothetical protein
MQTVLLLKLSNLELHIFTAKYNKQINVQWRTDQLLSDDSVNSGRC